MTHTPERMEDRLEEYKCTGPHCPHEISDDHYIVTKSFMRSEIEKVVNEVIGEDEKMVEDKYCKHCNKFEYDCRYYITDERNALLTSEVESEVYNFAKWWSEKQTKNEEDWIKRNSKSEAIKVVKEYIEQRKALSDIGGGK